MAAFSARSAYLMTVLRARSAYLSDGHGLAGAGEDLYSRQSHIMLVSPGSLNVYHQLLPIGQLWYHKVVIRPTITEDVAYVHVLCCSVL